MRLAVWFDLADSQTLLQGKQSVFARRGIGTLGYKGKEEGVEGIDVPVVRQMPNLWVKRLIVEAQEINQARECVSWFEMGTYLLYF